MSLKTRIARLEARLGTDDSPKRVIIFYGPDETGHEIRREPGGVVDLRVPCPEGGDPMDHLSPEQAALIGLSDSVAAFQAGTRPRTRPAVAALHTFDNGRDRPQIVLAEVGDDGRDPHLRRRPKVVMAETFDDGRDPDLPPLR
jgi:hypothetical protein